MQEYELYGVLVHQGHSMHSGHYYCFVKAPNGVWNRCDDSSVGQVRRRLCPPSSAATPPAREYRHPPCSLHFCRETQPLPPRLVFQPGVVPPHTMT